jgi:hypothetical protein
MSEFTIGEVNQDRLDEIVAYLSAHEIEAARQRGEIDPVASVQTLRLFDGKVSIAIDVKSREAEPVIFPRQEN